MGGDSKHSGTCCISRGLEPWVQSHAVRDEHQIGQQRGEGTVVGVILLEVPVPGTVVS